MTDQKEADEILKERRRRDKKIVNGGTSKGIHTRTYTSPIPQTVDPKVLNDAMKHIKRKIEENVPNAKDVEDLIEAYDRAMKGII